MKKTLAVLLVAAMSVSSIGLASSPAAADGWRDGYHRDRNDDYYRDRGRDDWDHGRRDHWDNGHKNRDNAIIAGIAGLALGAVIVGSLANQRQNAPVYARPANRDRLIYDPNY